MEQEEVIIKINNLSKIYNEGKENEVKALNSVSFNLNKGEFTVILGPSGAGKSTLLNILGGMDTPSYGDFIFEDANVSKYNPEELTMFRRKKIGFVFQFYNLIANLSAVENVQLASALADDPFDSYDILEKVGLAKRVNNFPPQLSGGEQQRVAIARALVKKPQLLLCDEPTGALDSKTGSTIIALLKDISKEFNISVVMVTHNAKIAECAERLIIVRDGQIDTDTVNKNPKKPEEINW